MSAAHVTQQLTVAQPVVITPARLAALSALADTSQERQTHGFWFQSAMNRAFDLTAPVGYTDPADGYATTSDGVPTGLHYQHKNIRVGGNIELGSFSRAAKQTEDFHLIVGSWAGTGFSVKNVHVMLVPGAYWQALFPADVSSWEAPSVFQGISNARGDDAAWKTRRSGLAARWQEEKPAGSPINWHAKRDHKVQRRVQCSISSKEFAKFAADCFDPVGTDWLRTQLDAYSTIL